MAGMPRLAPSSNDAASGKGTARSSGIATSSWAVPSARCHAASRNQTRCPTLASSTPSPTATIVPAPSWLGTTSGNGVASPGRFPWRTFQSVGFTPDNTTRTSTSPGAGSGSGRSTSLRTSGPPVSL
jgi:hypothetical protein